MQSFGDLPSYYKVSQVFNTMFKSGMYKDMNFDDFKRSESFLYIYDDSPINDIEKLYKVVESLNYWLVDSLPHFVLDFICFNIDGPFLFPLDLPFSQELIELWNKQIVDSVMFLFKDGSMTLDKIDDHELNNIVRDRYFKVEYSTLECGENFSAAIRNNGEIVLWGCIDTNFMFSKPVTFKEDGTVTEHSYKYSIIEGSYIDVKCGPNFVLAMKEDMTLISFNHKSKIYTPEGKFIKISCGEFFSCGINEDGTLVMWDNNRIIFRLLDNFKNICCTHDHVSVIRNDGGLSVLTYDDREKIEIDNIKGKYVSAVTGYGTFAAITEGADGEEEVDIVVSDGRNFKGYDRFTKIFTDKHQSLLAGLRVVGHDRFLVIYTADIIDRVINGSYSNVVFSDMEIMALHSPSDTKENNNGGSKISLIHFFGGVSEIEGLFTKIAGGMDHFSCVKLVNGIETLVSYGNNSYGQCNNIPTL